MHNVIRFFVCLSVSILMLQGCSMTAAEKSPADQTPPATATAQGSGEEGGLPAQNLPPGKCAIFLWEEKQERRLVFFQRSDSDVAQIHIEGRMLEARRTLAENEMVRGFFTRQQFTSGDRSITLRLQASDSKNIVEGIRIPNGVMTISAPDGGRLIVSMSGLFGCKV